MNLDAVGAALIADARRTPIRRLQPRTGTRENAMARADEEAAAVIEAARAEGAREAAERLARQRAGNPP